MLKITLRRIIIPCYRSTLIFLCKSPIITYRHKPCYRVGRDNVRGLLKFTKSQVTTPPHWHLVTRRLTYLLCVQKNVNLFAHVVKVGKHSSILSEYIVVLRILFYLKNDKICCTRTAYNGRVLCTRTRCEWCNIIITPVSRDRCTKKITKTKMRR